MAGWVFNRQSDNIIKKGIIDGTNE